MIIDIYSAITQLLKNVEHTVENTNSALKMPAKILISRSP